MFYNCRESVKYFMSPDWHSVPLLSTLCSSYPCLESGICSVQGPALPFLGCVTLKESLNLPEHQTFICKMSREVIPSNPFSKYCHQYQWNEHMLCKLYNCIPVTCHILPLCRISHLLTLNLLSSISTNSNSPVLFSCSLSACWIYPTCFLFLSIYLWIYLSALGLSCGPRDR